MNMQTIGTATPVVLLQTDTSTGAKTRADFPSDRAFVKYLLKKEKAAATEKDKKKDGEKKTKTFTYPELVFILMATSFPISMVQIALGYAVFKIVRVLATGQ